jgi:hypothetical protein
MDQTAPPGSAHQGPTSDELVTTSDPSASALGDEAITSRKAAAYHAGRLTNQLSWHLQPSLLFRSKKADKLVNQVFNELVAVSVHLAAPGEEAFREIDEIRYDWSQSFRSEGLAIEVSDYLYSPEEEYDPPLHEFCRELIQKWCPPLHSRVHEVFVSGMRDDERRAFDLGECLDQGIYPLQAFRAVYKTPSVEDDEEVSERNGQSPRQTSQFQYQKPWANYWPLPGELRPVESWPSHLQTLGNKADIPGIAGILQPSVLKSIMAAPPADRCSMVQELDRQIRNALARKPSWNRHEGTLMLNGVQCHEYKDPAENQRKVLDAFEDLGWPEVIESPWLDTKDPQQETHRRVLKELNRTLRNCITFHSKGKGTRIAWRRSKPSEACPNDTA